MSKVFDEFIGGAVRNNYGILTPVGFGKRTKLILSEDRLVEITKRLITTRYCEIRLTRIESAEIIEQGIVWFPILALFTCWFSLLAFSESNAVGILLLLISIVLLGLYFFIKNKYLVFIVVITLYLYKFSRRKNYQLLLIL
ncbi:hypothetical protein [Picosynechococcus sp. NKBG042902]|uniref:hypothetical protein n=1 Tax=Picosynechococcus sp. NKBG042902 TaxID=490193 RepID=UPI0004A9F434|nr:hypothetical protein [Picosynechococcus sp. NKBG042902]